MKDKFSKFTDIKQFRGVVGNVKRTASFCGYDENEEAILIEPTLGSLPTLTFEITTKIHGTNAGIGIDDDGNIYAMSRSKVLIPGQSDNAGFAVFVESHKDWFKETLEYMKSQFLGAQVFLYGEWCGRGIQGTVAVNQIDKRLVLFTMKVVDASGEGCYFRIPKEIQCPEQNIFNIREIGTRKIEIDFNKPSESLDELLKIVDEVEAECPVGKYFGVEGIGEGVVVANYDIGNKREHIFKVKGEKHCGSSKAKSKKHKPKNLTPEENDLREVVADEVTPIWRLEQSIENVCPHNEPPSMRDLGGIIKWVRNDIIKEDLDIITKNKLELSDLNSYINSIIKKWFFKLLNTNAGL